MIRKRGGKWTAILDRDLISCRRITEPKRRPTEIIALIVVTVVTLSIVTVGLLQIRGGNEVTHESPAPARISYVSHAPISIYGNGGFLGDNSSTGISWGSGSEDDPFVIEGWEIHAIDTPGIWIQYSNMHFTIRNCLISSTGKDSINPICIFLVSCAGGLLVNNTCSDSTYGILLGYGCLGVSLINNTLLNDGNGVRLEGTFDRGTNFTLTAGNTFIGCINGIASKSFSSYNTFIDNEMTAPPVNNTGWGIYLEGMAVNCTILNNRISGYVGGGGIRLFGLSGNNTVANNMLTECGVSLLAGSDNNTVTDNTATYIVVDESNNNTVLNNGCANFFPIDIGQGAITLSYGSRDNAVLNNTCSNSRAGISLLGHANHNTLANNTCSNNDIGILLWSDSGTETGEVSYNTFVDNAVSDSATDGFYIQGQAHDNMIWNNTFRHNNGSGDTYDPLHIQAFSNGARNWWNSTDGYGNWWSDWTVPDDDMNGIVDVPYDTGGAAGDKDYYPRTNYIVPEFSSSIVLALVLVGMMAVVIGLRRAGCRKGQ